MNDESIMNIGFSDRVFIPNSTDKFSQVQSGVGMVQEGDIHLKGIETPTL